METDNVFVDSIFEELGTYKKNLIKYKKYYLIYVIFVLVSAFSLITLSNIEHPKMELIFIVITLILGTFCLSFYFTHNNEKELYKTVFVILLVFGLVCAFVVPICEQGDSHEHLARAEITSRGILFPEYNGINYTNIYENNSKYVWDGTGFEVIDSVTFFEKNLHETVFETPHDTDKINYTLTNTSQCFEQNPFYGYLPQAVGILIAKLLDLNQIWMLWCGNIVNLLCFATIISYAVKKTPILKVPIIVTACIPLFLFQGASMSIDSLIYALSILIISYFFYMYKSDEGSLTYRNVLIFLALCLLVGLCKLTLFGFMLLLFAVPKRNYNDKRLIIFAIIGMIILSIIALIYSNGAQESLWHSLRAKQYLAYNVNATQQLSFIFSDHNWILVPANYLDEIHHVFNTLFPAWKTAGWKSVGFLSQLIFFFIGFVYLGYPINEKISRKSRIIAFITLIIIIFGTYLVQYLTWTPLGQLQIKDSVNTRYFLPVFALCPFIFNLNSHKSDERIQNYTILIPIAFLSVMILSIVFQFY